MGGVDACEMRVTRIITGDCNIPRHYDSFTNS